MELQVQTQQLAPIQANLAEIKTYVENAVAKYENAFYAEDEIKQAKADRADLRKLKADIEAKRKAVKQAWNAPYAKFEAELKAITGLIDKPVMLIDEQVKGFEARRKEARLAVLEDTFNRNNPIGNLLQFDSILDQTWLNASVSEAKAVRGVIERLETIKKDLAQLESVVSAENRTICIEHYLSTFNLADSIIKDTLLLAKKKQQEEVLGAVIVEQQIADPETLYSSAKEEVEDIFADIPLQKKEEYPETRKFLVTGAPSKINALYQWARDNKVTIREIF